mgnify:CR=1 FL=1|tara:strand:+ start:76 stop:306 length:231 start_codon:yes stop_codon:yes gene_type:complete
MSKNILVDARNTYCPGPLMELITYMRQADVGDTLELLSTDEGTVDDVPEWVNKIGHKIVSSEQIDEAWHIKICKLK